MASVFVCGKCNQAVKLDAEIPELYCPSCRVPMRKQAPGAPAVVQPQPQQPTAWPMAGGQPPTAGMTTNPGIKVARLVSPGNSTTGGVRTAMPVGTPTTGSVPTVRTAQPVQMGQPMYQQAPSQTGSPMPQPMQMPEGYPPPNASASSGRALAAAEGDTIRAQARQEAAAILHHAREQAHIILSETQRNADNVRAAAESEAAAVRQSAEANALAAAEQAASQKLAEADAMAKTILSEAQKKADAVQGMLANAQADMDAYLQEKRRTADAEAAAMKEAASKEIAAMKDAAAKEIAATKAVANPPAETPNDAAATVVPVAESMPQNDAAPETPAATEKTETKKDEDIAVAITITPVAAVVEAPEAAVPAKKAAPKPARKGVNILDAETQGLSETDKAAYHEKKRAKAEEAKKEAVKIMLGTTGSGLVLAIVGFTLAAKWQSLGGGVKGALIGVLVLDIAFMGYMGWIIYKHWKIGKEATARLKERQTAMRDAAAAAKPATDSAVTPDAMPAATATPKPEAATAGRPATGGTKPFAMAKPGTKPAFGKGASGAPAFKMKPKSGDAKPEGAAPKNETP